MSAVTDLVELPPKETALQVFSAANGLDPFLQKIRAEIDGFVPDVSTRKGREAIASIAYKVARSKTALDNVGKELVAELKEVPKKIDAERKRMRELLESWQDEVRKPLDEWEAAEKARVDGHQQRLAELRSGALSIEGRTAAELLSAISLIDEFQIDASWEEFETEAHRVKAETITALREAVAKRQQYEAEQEELATLRRLQAEQEQRDREARIAQEAAEKARIEAEQAAQREREAAAERERQLQAQAEQAKREAERKAQEQRDAAERQVREAREATERAERERLEAQQRAEQAVRDAAAQSERAAQAERQRIADEQAEQERQARAREANIEHRKQINNAALKAFIAGGMTEECAKQAITLIAKGQIPNIKITY